MAIAAPPHSHVRCPVEDEFDYVPKRLFFDARKMIQRAASVPTKSDLTIQQLFWGGKNSLDISAKQLRHRARKSTLSFRVALCQFNHSETQKTFAGYLLLISL
jgi:hypothetical protein